MKKIFKKSEYKLAPHLNINLFQHEGIFMVL